MSRLLLTFYVIFLQQLSAFGQDYWQQRDTVNGPPKSAASTFVLGNRAYVVAGTDDFEYKRKMYSYRADQDDWDDELSLGGEGGSGLDRVGAVSFSLEIDGQKKGYVCMGQTQTIGFINDLWEYDRTTESWTQKANFAGVPRREAVSFVIENTAYVGTGNSIEGLKNDFYAYDPQSNSWSQISDFPGTPRQAAVAFSMDAYGFVGTGDDGTLRNDFWMYNAQTDQWIQKANFPGAARSGACGWAAFPVCYLGTGEDANHNFHKDIWEYNYYLNNWTQRANLPGPGRKNAIAFYLDGWGHIGTGYNNGTFLDDLWAYSGTTGLENSKPNKFDIWPNPSTDFIELPSNLVSPKVEVYSAQGQKMNISLNMRGSRWQLDVRDLPQGRYFLNVNDQGSLYSTTFVKC
mgnify:FL=1